jgi:Chitobiase/beta-hexosaminidase C-terminal domain/PQQ-like domain
MGRELQMLHSAPGRCALAALIFLACLTPVIAQVSVTTYHNDLGRTGQNTRETTLTPANVNSTQFGKLYSVPVDGAVYAQPLYLWALNIAGGTHNVLYVVTEHDSVYALDADTGTVYVRVSLIPSGGSTVNSSSDLGCGDLTPEVGITGTPVIDPTTGTLYVVAKSKVGGSIVQYLHALDVTTLAEKLGGPVLIQASVAGNGLDASAGLVSFNAKQENQRAALALSNGHVIIGWGGHCDLQPWHGWVMSYSASTLAQEAVFNASPNGSASGVWMSGAGPAVDGNGNVYLATGNGDWNGTTDYGDSILKLGPPANGNFTVLDYFTPYDQGALNSGDVDLGSGGLVLLPPLSSGKVLLAQQGKAGTIVLLDTTSLGKYCVNLPLPCTNRDTQIAQEIQNASAGIWGSAAYWNGNLYWTGANDTINAYSFNTNNSGLISTTPTSRSARSFAFSAPTPVVSSNGSSNGILWALDGAADNSTCGTSGADCLGLFAYDATNLANLLYTSSQAANNRDSPGAAVKFENPIVANGKVFVGTLSSVSAYGLLLPPAAAPTFSPASGTYTSTQLVTLSSTTAGASIYFTTNGTTPSTSSTPYTGPITVSSSVTIKAIAVASGYSTSSVASGTYVINTGTTIQVSLSGNANVYGIGANGSAIPSGGLDNDGYAYSATLLGTSLNWNGNTYLFGSAGVVDALSNTTIPLPAGSYTTLSLLATGVNGNQPNQTFTVNYSDGSSTSFTQSLSDWFTPQNYAGESKALQMAYRIAPNGTLDNRTFYLYGYSFALNPAKLVTSLTLPKTRNVIVLAVDLH